MEMEMEREEALVVEESSELKARRRQRGKSSNRGEETTGEAPSWTADEKAEGGGGEAEQRSVYFDADHGVWKCWHCTWTCQFIGPGRHFIENHEGRCQAVMDVKSPKLLESFYGSSSKEQAAVEDDIGDVQLEMEDQIVSCEELPNEKSGFKSNMISEQKDITAEEVNHILKNPKMEDGSNLQSYSKVKSNGTTKSQDEITVDEWTPVLKWSKAKDVGFDLERVLEEQDTHDLYCPNCNSCITKRVILRKRKRSVRQIQSDAPSKRMHEEHCGAEKLDTEAVSGEMRNPSDAQEPDIFRCLSCFSFFIPTEGGFNLFSLFEKGKGNHVQSSEQLPDKKVNWISSIFKVDKSKSKGSEPGASLTTEIIQTRETPMLSGDAELCQNSSFPENNNSAMANGSACTVSREEMPNHSQINKQDLSTILSVKKFDAIGSATAVIDADVPVSGPSDVSIKEQLRDQTEEYDPATEIISTPGATIQIKYLTNSGAKADDVSMRSDAEVNAIQITSQNDQIIQGSEATSSVVLPHPDLQIDVAADQIGRDTEMNNDWDVLKSIVYGGLIESITSLSVVSSAAGSKASTSSIVAMGLANFFGGFLLIIHELFELRTAQDEAAEQRDEQVGRYWKLLGRRANFRLHFVVAITSYILAGILPPLIYGFSFRKSDDKEYKLIAVAAVSLPCIALLAIGKAHVRPQRAYLKTLFYYLSVGVSSSATSYIVGEMINRLLEKFGLFDHTTAPSSPPTNLTQVVSFGVPAARASH